MSGKLDHLRALARVCRDFGGRLAIVSQREFDRLFERGGSKAAPHGDEELSDSPFTSAHGLWWRRKIVYAVAGREEIGSIIHEMGHVFAAPHHPHHACDACREWDWFGWEITIARQVDAARTWARSNDNYQISGGRGEAHREWGQLSAQERRVLVVERLARARKIGVLAVDGTPRSVR